MTVLFTPKNIGPVEIQNRFVHSATYEAMASPEGHVTEEILARYRKLAKGEVGLIIPGHMFIHPHGRAGGRQIGIHSDDMIPGLTALAAAIHDAGSRVFFQLAHAGIQTSPRLIGRTPMGPSDTLVNPAQFFTPARMTEMDIRAAITAFGEAARRAAQAGADGVQIHGAHGYLVSEFLSPFTNDRADAWGGTAANRFRFLHSVVLEAKKNLRSGMALIVKINGNDHTDGGVTAGLARDYCGLLAGLGIDGVEISGGLGVFSFMTTVRGDVPVEGLLARMSEEKKALARPALESLMGKYTFFEGYNLEDASAIKPALGNIPLIAVGGMRSREFMDTAIVTGPADFVSLSRPFVREPFLVKRLREGHTAAASCGSCNQCFAAVGNGLPVKCYNTALPPADSRRENGLRPGGPAGRRSGG